MIYKSLLAIYASEKNILISSKWYYHLIYRIYDIGIYQKYILKIFFTAFYQSSHLILELFSPVQVSDIRHVQYPLLPSDLMYLTLQYHEYTITITIQYQTNITLIYKETLFIFY